MTPGRRVLTSLQSTRRPGSTPVSFAAHTFPPKL